MTPGTTVTGTLTQAITKEEVVAYLTPIVRFLDVPVTVAGRLLTRKSFLPCEA